MQLLENYFNFFCLSSNTEHCPNKGHLTTQKTTIARDILFFYEAALHSSSSCTSSTRQCVSTEPQSHLNLKKPQKGDSNTVKMQLHQRILHST